ncbi:MAG: DUF4294 domain-containing protein [Paludibacteraceae bacterium]|nr:DUF4294 domain-containing protein [Paludibacteraceae bacterium]
MKTQKLLFLSTMSSLVKYTLLLLCLFFSLHSFAEEKNKQTEGVLCRMVVKGNDTVPHIILRTVYVFPPEKFKNKRQEKFYWKTVYNVKKVLPYAKIVGKILAETNDTLMKIPKEKDRKKYMKQLEKNIFKTYEGDMKKFTLSQGKLLIQLIDRECDQTSYSLIKSYRGGFVAAFWQGFARLLGADLKSDFDIRSSEKDKMVERIILLVESGQL